MTLLSHLNITAQDPEDSLSPVIYGNNHSFIIIQNNEIISTGAKGIELVNATGVLVSDNDITLGSDYKQTGVKISHMTVDYPVEFIILDNNRIHNGGIIVAPETGKNGCPKMDTVRITRNTISNSKFWGILVDALEEDVYYLTNFVIRDNHISNAQSHYTNLLISNIYGGGDNQ